MILIKLETIRSIIRVFSGLRIRLQDTIGLRNIQLLLSPQHVLSSLATSRLPSFAVLVLIADFLEFMNVRFKLPSVSIVFR